MNEGLFKQLVESVRQAGAIRRGENESLPDQALRDHAALVMRQVSTVCGISVLDYRVNDAAQEEVLTEIGWRRVSELLDAVGRKP